MWSGGLLAFMASTALVAWGGTDPCACNPKAASMPLSCVPDAPATLDEGIRMVCDTVGPDGHAQLITGCRAWVGYSAYAGASSSKALVGVYLYTDFVVHGLRWSRRLPSRERALRRGAGRVCNDDDLLALGPSPDWPPC
jgi:hypothetical protein